MSSKSKEELREGGDEDNEDEEEDEEEEEEEEEYAEAEPVLTYSRMKNDVNEILTQDSVSCIKAGHKVKKDAFLVCYLKKINKSCIPSQDTCFGHSFWPYSHNGPRWK